ncbi:SRPBCC family protein [Nocardioides alcanivorans]|uniref:SRPBCC family protein n=1 Tax=Nocardioides alcanivorans TaxID=2897352 RepID=UPI001F206056|nr:carbon monoxide dehydrogenase subunit G [Nocardioides alcanivorans]
MKFTGQNVLNASVEKAWQALLDPAVLVQTIPGCERLEATGENAYAMTVTAGVASIKGTYAGTCVMSDLVDQQSLKMKLDGAGAPGTIGAVVDVAFADNGDGTTTIRYEADAVVGGMIGGVGQRMLTSVSRRMAGEFFGNVDKVLSGAVPAAAAAATAPAGAPAAVAEPGAAPAAGAVFTAPVAARGTGSPDDFVKGVVLGAGLVLVGVVVGGIFGRRR